MGVVLALLSALCYGSSDFTAGVGGRRSDPAAVTVIAQPFGLVAAAVAVIALSARSPTPHALWWGALSGVGSGVGTVSLFRGLAVAPMSVVAPLSAVLSAALPVVAGLLLGEHWSPGNFVDISIMPLLVPNCQIGARNPLGLSCRADVVSGRDCNIARCSRTRRS